MEHLAGFITEFIGNTELANWILIGLMTLAFFLFAASLIFLITSILRIDQG